MDKSSLQQQGLEQLARDLLQVEHAAWVAHETAPHQENITENKYDTLGLEAAYLATGQARRAEAIRQAMASWRQFRPHPYDASQSISSARWSAWSMPTTGSSSSLSARLAAA